MTATEIAPTAHVTADKLAGALWGLAFGDSWGFPTEFYSYQELLKKHGLTGPEFPGYAKVSDDTQMSLAVWRALDEVTEGLAGGGISRALCREFVAFRDDEDNNRAPGATCMTALHHLQGVAWHTSTVMSSKGCGTVMRAPWIGVHPKVTDPYLAVVAQTQAGITHGHPTAIVAAEVTASVCRALARGECTPATATHYAVRATEAFQLRGSLKWLWQQAGWAGEGEYRRLGVRETVEALYRVGPGYRHLIEDPWDGDPCEYTGEGWTAEECLATALLIVRLFPNDPVQAIRRAAMTGGDSDSIGAVVGAFTGAAHGDIWPTAFREALEPRYRLEIAAAIEEATP